jgi:hypothetical protein
MKRLILTGCPTAIFHKADFAELVIDFIHRFVWGPLLSPDKLNSYLGPRTPDLGPVEHWSDLAFKWSGRWKRERNGGLVEFCDQFDVVEMWFDIEPNAQLQMVWLLDYFRAYPEIIDKLKLRLVDLEMTGLQELGKWKPQLFAVTERELSTASAVWQAYRATTPEGCLDLLSRDLSALPLLKLALLQLLDELPSRTTGLGMTEMRMLEVISWGYANVNPLFYFRDLRGTYVFGQFELAILLEGLAHGPVPAVAGLDDELRTLDRENHGARLDAFRRSRLSLTEFGKAVVAHKEDFSRHNPIDRWWGGTRLTSDNLWRWNPALIKPVSVAAGRRKS